MKYDANRIYLSWTRHCIMDIINEFSIDEEIIKPRPDYIEYPALVYLRKDGTYCNLEEKNKRYKYAVDNEFTNNTEYYENDLILRLNSLYKNPRLYNKVSRKEAICKFNKVVNDLDINPYIGYKEKGYDHNVIYIKKKQKTVDK